jgi:hypothetical protein
MSESPPPPAVRSVAGIATPHAGKYLIQLCKHFQHKLPVVSDERSGQITFPAGVCRLRAEGETLTLSLEAGDAAQMATLQDVVARHLVRFAFREELTIDWRAA